MMTNQELLANHNISGIFYSHGTYNFRKLLRIVNKENPNGVIDLLVIMMNPGSSKQESDTEILDKEVNCRPDPTQYQIMRVMENTSRKHAVVLNLSDLRNAKSQAFYKRIPELESSFEAHSIFSESRYSEIESYLQISIPVIAAWGVSPKLDLLSQKAWNLLHNTPVIGWFKDENKRIPYHPYPRHQAKRKEWIIQICNHLS